MRENNLKFTQKIVKNREITIGAKALFFYILNLENTDYPTRNQIAFDLNISNQTLGKYLKELIQNGYIKCEQCKENGKFKNNRYTIKGGE